MDDFFVDNPLRLTCADAVELVTEVLDDALAADDLRRFEAHLEGCRACQVYVDQVRLTVRIAAEAGPSIEVPAPDVEALVRRFEEREP